MIEITDTGLQAAVEQATGHASPYAPAELAQLPRLRVQHAADLSALRHCTGLAELTLIACDVRNLDEPARLERLTTLHVLGCPVEDAAALAGHPELTDLRIDFGFLRDLAPLTTIARLRRGRFLGNPIDPASWDGIRPGWQRSRTADTGRLRLLEFGPQLEWEYVRQAWELGVRLCSARLDGLRPVLVRPGVPRTPGTVVDAIYGFGAAVAGGAQRGETTDEIYRRNRDWATGQGLEPPTNFASHRTLGDAVDARAWLAEASDLGEVDRMALERFTAHFLDGLFYREDSVVHAAMAEQAGVTVPAPLARSRSVLAGLLPDGTRFRLAGRAADEAATWYVPAPGEYSSAERTRLFRDEAGLFPLAEWVETGHSILAARLGGGDPAIYEFGEEDLQVTRRMDRPLGESVHRVFASHAELLAAIAAYRYPDGTEIAAIADDREQ